jgi:hypothetical protein
VRLTDDKRACFTRAIRLGASFIVALLVVGMRGPANVPHTANSATAAQTHDSVGARLRVRRAELPLNFEPNVGQADPQVKFLARGNGYRVSLTADEAVLVLKKTASAPKNAKLRSGQSSDRTLRSKILTGRFPSRSNPERPEDYTALAMRLVGANPRAEVTGFDKLASSSNYFMGGGPADWHTQVPNFGKVRYQDIYRGVDLVYYGNENHLEYDFVVAPGADPGLIRLAFTAKAKEYQKAYQPRLDSNGDLVIDAEGREVRFRKPFVYQTTSQTGVRTPIESRYVRKADNQLGFELGPYDHSQTLVIDPVLTYSTYLGGNGVDEGYGVSVDVSGNIIVAGTTASTNFPTSNAYQGTYGGNPYDVFVTKFDPTGTTLMYSTYLGGTSYDYGEALALDSGGNAYVTGYTHSNNFPTLNALPGFSTRPQSDQSIFVSKLDPAGALVFSTYFGGHQNPATNDDEAFGIAVDATGVYFAGNTTSGNYPTTSGAFQQTPPAIDDAFLTKLSLDGTMVLYSTYLGGPSGSTQAWSVAVDSAQSAYLVGQTKAIDFPTKNPYQATNFTPAGGSIFVTKFTSDGSALVYSTYLGGKISANINYGASQSAGHVAVDSAGNAYVVGGTTCSDFPTLNPFQASQGGSSGAWDVIVSKFNTSGGLAYSTFLGGSLDDFGDAITVDSNGNAYVAGYESSADFPTTANAFQLKNNGNFDGFVTELNSAGNAAIYSSYLGGSANDDADAIGLGTMGNVYLTGSAGSTATSATFPIVLNPTTGTVFQATPGSTKDAFLAVVGAVQTFPLSVTLSGSGTGTVTSSPNGINCGTVCSATFASGTVTLTATPASGSTFTGWSGGGCSGTAPCAVNMNAAQSVTATFTGTATFPLTLTLAGSGTGTVTSNPPGINCGPTCSASFSGTVTLTATAAAGSTFTGWSGACSGTATCSVTMTQAQSVTATFGVAPTFALSVTLAGSGTGSVTSNPSGINCGAVCSANFASGSMVLLTATPAAGATFTGWSGACTGAGTCSVTMSGAQSATATFATVDFKVSAASSTLSVSLGGQGTDVITFTPQNGAFANAIQLTCAVSGAAPMPSCGLSPSSVTPGTNPATSTLTITAPARSVALAASDSGRFSARAYCAFLPLLAIVMIGVGTARRASKERHRHLWILASLFVALVILQTGCGSGSATKQPPPPQNYSVTVTATSGSLTHTTQIAVTVQ